jgi:hypothetical protein
MHIYIPTYIQIYRASSSSSSFDGEEKCQYGWYSCDGCINHLSEERCVVNIGCLWIKDDNINDGICVTSLSSSSSSSSSSEIITNLRCEMLLKHHCDKYVNVNNNNSDVKSGVIIEDAPCFFNGVDDSSEMVCVSKSSLESKSCENIKTNSIIIYEGEERESCNEADIIFGWGFICE